MEEKEEERQIYLEQRERLGQALISIFKNTLPIGSLILDPVVDDYIIADLNDTVNRWESLRRQRKEKQRIKRNGRESEGDAY